MKSGIASLALLASFAVSAHAQQTAQNSPKPVYGSVTGHVYCSDTNDPARLATVTLLPIADTLNPVSSKGPRAPQHEYRPAQTLLDGSFALPHVTPGYYYVVVQYPGYLSPISRFSEEDLAHPSVEQQKLIASVLPTISVEADHTSTIEIRLQRGGSISGTVRFDDGSPAPGLLIWILRQDGKGKWVAVPLSRGVNRQSAQTNDQGTYRIAGIPAGEYIVRVQLDLNDIGFSSFFGGGSVYVGSKYTLSVFSGGQTREKDAKRIRLHEGEDDSMEDIVIPVSKLHPVSGTIVQARTGQTVNAGKVVLINADDKSEVASAKVDPNDSAFHFAFVPEGTYILKVDDARDVSREDIPTRLGRGQPYTRRRQPFGATAKRSRPSLSREICPASSSPFPINPPRPRLRSSGLAGPDSQFFRETLPNNAGVILHHTARWLRSQGSAH